MVQHIMLDQKVKSYSKTETLHKPSMYSWMNVAPRLTTASIRIPLLLLSVLAASYITFESTSEQEWSCSGTQLGAEHKEALPTKTSAELSSSPITFDK